MWGDSALPLVVDEPMLEIDYPEDVPAVEEALRRMEQGLPLVPESGARIGPPRRLAAPAGRDAGARAWSVSHSGGALSSGSHGRYLAR